MCRYSMFTKTGFSGFPGIFWWLDEIWDQGQILSFCNILNPNAVVYYSFARMRCRLGTRPSWTWPDPSCSWRSPAIPERSRFEFEVAYSSAKVSANYSAFPGSWSWLAFATTFREVVDSHTWLGSDQPWARCSFLWVILTLEHQNPKSI